MARAEYIFQLVRMLSVFPEQRAKNIRHKVLESAAEVDHETPAHEVQARRLYIAVPEGWKVMAPRVLAERHWGSRSVFIEEASTADDAEVKIDPDETVPHENVLFLAIAPNHAKRLREGRTVSATQFPSGLELANGIFGPERIGYRESQLPRPLLVRKFQVGRDDDPNVGVSFGVKSLYMNAGQAANLCHEHGLAQPEAELYHPQPRTPSLSQLAAAQQQAGSLRRDADIESLLAAYPRIFAAPDRYRLADCSYGIFKLYQTASLCFSGPAPTAPFERSARRQEAAFRLLEGLPKRSREKFVELKGVELIIALLDPCDQSAEGGRHFTLEASKAVAALDKKFGKREEFVSKAFALIIHSTLAQFGPKKPPPFGGQKRLTLRGRLEALGFDDAEKLTALLMILTVGLPPQESE